MKEITFDVPDVSCEHCVNAITKETTAAGVNNVVVDLNTKRVFVAFDEAKVSEEQVKEAIEEAGYDIAGQQEGKAISVPTGNSIPLNFK
ncbi:MAG TPA: copper ion binding protein [Chloroflexia bacterium]|nr:copper ion binding protein [Chloroflexia bacterium]